MKRNLLGAAADVVEKNARYVTCEAWDCRGRCRGQKDWGRRALRCWVVCDPVLEGVGILIDSCLE